MAQRMLLVQPAYPYGKAQVYLPGSLLNLGSRLMAAGIEPEIADLNLDPTPDWDKYDALGFNILGAPYIPEVMHVVQAIRANGCRKPVLIGGQGIVRVRPDHFARWFGGLDKVYQATDDRKIEEVLGLTARALPDAFETSMRPMMEKLSASHLKQYLTREFSLFISQGCSFSCDFCQADKGRPETYRTRESLADELRFICEFLASIGHPELRVYLSNLDGLQTPKKFEDRLALMHTTAQDHGLRVSSRCLATSKMTAKHAREDAELLRRLRGYGLRTIALGADGADEATWRKLNKRHNKMSDLMESISAIQEADIEVELLMVAGFSHETLGSRLKSIAFSLREAMRGCAIRPYLAKEKTPASKGWVDGDASVEGFLTNPKLLSRLDYSVLGSTETHPVWWQRWLANACYLTVICALTPFGKCHTSPLVPVPQAGPSRTLAQFINKLMPFDR